jgi:hypothetical protein
MKRRLAGLFVAATVGLLLSGAEPTVAGPAALGQQLTGHEGGGTCGPVAGVGVAA